jgi:hypothetical protein
MTVLQAIVLLAFNQPAVSATGDSMEVQCDEDSVQLCSDSLQRELRLTVTELHDIIDLDIEILRQVLNSLTTEEFPLLKVIPQDGDEITLSKLYAVNDEFR